jgi:hypothetical protein
MDVPYLTIVVTGRNDGHGGDFIGRLQCFLKTTCFLAEKFRCALEIIVVEWNPPSNRPGLADAVVPVEKNNFVSIKIITVSSAIHNKITGDSGLPMLEWHAKNCGAVRAKGQFILLTNPDIVFSGELFAFLAERKLTKEYFYRAVRKDVLHPADAQRMQSGDIIAHCEKNVLCVQGPLGTMKGGRPGITDRLMLVVRFILCKTLPNFRLFTNAAGDFLLTHSENFAAVCGYPEWPRGSFVDGYLCYLLANGKTREYVLPFTECIYHLEHERPKKAGLLRYRAGLLGIMYKQVTRINAPETWGLQGYSLQETDL